MKISFHSCVNKTNFHMKSFTLSLDFTMRFFKAIPKWLIAEKAFYLSRFYLTSLVNQRVKSHGLGWKSYFLYCRIEQLKALLEESTTSESDSDESSEDSSEEEKEKRRRKKARTKHKRKARKKRKHRHRKLSKDTDSAESDSREKYSRGKRKERWHSFDVNFGSVTEILRSPWTGRLRKLSA